MNYTKIDIELYISQFNGSMVIEVSDDNGLITVLKECIGTIKLTHKLNFPNCLKFKLSNKNPKFDTKVVNGEIVADKYTQLTSLTVGNIPVDINTLFKICHYNYDQVTSYNTFWAFNGEVSIEFHEQDFIIWHLMHNNKFEI